MAALSEVLRDDVPTTTADALALFDSLPAVDPGFMIGTWHGAELPTGHPLDGILAASGWWGKRFRDTETVDPLLFPTADGTGLFALNPAPAFAGLGLFTRFPMLKNQNFTAAVAALRPALQARGPRARLRTTRYRGVDTATMIYDELPINDVFRLVDDTPGSEVVLGAMDLRGYDAPYFFVLLRDATRS